MKISRLDTFERLVSAAPGSETFARILNLLVALLVLWASPIPSFAQRKPVASPTAPQPATSAPTDPTNPQDTVPLPQIVAEMEALTRLLEEIEQRLDPGPSLSAIDPTLRRLEQEINEGKDDVEATIAQAPSLAELSALERDWRARSDPYAKLQKELSERITMLESDLRLLDERQAQWQATIDRIEGDAALKEIIDRVRSKIADIQTIRSRITGETNDVVVLQNKVSMQDQMVAETLERIAEAKGLVQRSLLVPDSPPLWKTDFAAPAIFKPSYSRGITRFTQFVKARRSVIYGPIAIFALALLFAIGFKRRLPRLTTAGHIQEHDAHLFNRPLSLAMLAALMWVVVVSPALPVMMRNLIAALLLLPMVRLFLPLVEPVWRPLAYSLAAFGLASAAVEVFGAWDQTRRVGAALLDAAAIVMFVWLVQRSRRSGVVFGKRAILTLAAIRIGLLILLASLVANVLGYTTLSHVLRAGTILTSYLAVILYTVYRVTNALSSVLLRSHLADSIRAVRSQSETVLRWVSRAFEIGALLIWLYASLSFFTIREEVLDRVAASLSASMSLGTISLSLGDVLTFLLTLILGVTAAKVIRALLQEDVIPRLSLKRGLPAAVSTLIYYALVTAVFFFALAAGGADFSRLTVMTGAFGLGVGFGLQTVINNLASGMLLLLERPINIGDILEVEGVTGAVKRIGLRSSTIRTSQGAEVIVPNSDLITNHVTNWTLSERNRRVDVPIGVAYGTDPERVIKLLVDTASSHPDTVRDPAPVALFVGFGDSSLNFELRFWAPHARTYQHLKSEVAISIIAALREAEIHIPFAQREIHVKGLDASFKKAMAEDVKAPDAAPGKEQEG